MLPIPSAAILGAFLLISQSTRVDSFTFIIQSNEISFPSTATTVYHMKRHAEIGASTNGNNISHPEFKKRRHNASGKQHDIRPTARFLAVSALSSGSVSSSKDNVDSVAFAARRLEQDERYQQLDPRDRAFARLLVVSDLFDC